MFGTDGSEILTLLLGIALLILGIMALLMPVYVYQIRNRAQDMDKKLGAIIKLLGDQKGQGATEPKIKTCPFCGAKHRITNFKCAKCGKAIGL